MTKSRKEDKKADATAADEAARERIIPVGSEHDTAPKEERSAAEEPTGQDVSEVDQLKALVAQLEDQKLRALADLDNFRKRTARQFEETIRSANERLLCDMLEVVDNFERALQHTDESNDASAGAEAIRKGTELIYHQMRDLLARYDVTPIESVGKAFDPNLHEALMPIASDEYDEGTVAMEISKGYKQGDRVLRHAKVGVSQGPKGASEDDAK